MLSRMTKFWDTTFFDEKNNPKQGHEYRFLFKAFGYEKIGILLRWKDGRLNDDGELPAVEFQDSHIEHYRNGLLHNETRAMDGFYMPAIVSSYGNKQEFWVNGKQIQPPKDLNKNAPDPKDYGL